MVIDKDNIKILLLILVLGLGIGYAYINSDLNINGTARVDHANWDVHWANIQVTTGSVTGSNVVTQPTISNGTTVTYSVILSIPGDYYEFTVGAVNGGVIDAMIDTIDSKLNGSTITTLPAYLNYSVKYSDGTELEPNHELLANTTETYKVRVEYSTDINLNQIPASNQTLSLQFTVTYRQKTNVAIPVRNYVYRSNPNNAHIGDSISTLGTTYITYQDVVNNTGFSFLRHKIVNNQVAESVVGFVYNSNVYYNLDSIYYEQNKATLLSAFGSNNCTEDFSGSNPHEYDCTISGTNIHARAYSYGDVDAYNSNWCCYVEADNSSKCIDDM